MGGVDLHRVGVQISDIGAQILQDPQKQIDIADLGNVFNTAQPADHQGGGNNGDSGIFCATDMDISVQGTTALDNIFGQKNGTSLQQYSLVIILCPGRKTSYRDNAVISRHNHR